MNNDLISRSALLERMKRTNRYFDIKFDIMEEPAVDAGPKWISVEDRLPEESGEYLVVTRGGVCMTMAYSAVHRVFNAFDWGEANAPINCDYWMFLPEMPKEV